MSTAELRQFLLERATDGFCFPLNPKWLVCDEGWYAVLAAMRKIPESRIALESWYPPESGILEKIDELAQRHPEGFKPSGQIAKGDNLDPDEAELMLKRHVALKRAKRKLKMLLMFAKSTSTRAEASTLASRNDVPAMEDALTEAALQNPTATDAELEAAALRIQAIQRDRIARQSSLAATASVTATEDALTKTVLQNPTAGLYRRLAQQDISETECPHVPDLPHLLSRTASKPLRTTSVVDPPPILVRSKSSPARLLSISHL